MRLAAMRGRAWRGQEPPPRSDISEPRPSPFGDFRDPAIVRFTTNHGLEPVWSRLNPTRPPNPTRTERR
jgi:hypothetical protein